MTDEMKEQLEKIKKEIIYNDDGTISIKKEGESENAKSTETTKSTNNSWF